MASSHTSSPRPYNDFDFDDVDSSENDAEREYSVNFSDEDTEDASETDMVKQEEEYTEIKEQMYQDKLLQLKKQLQQLQDGNLPEFVKRNRRIEQQYKESLIMNETWKDYQLEVAEREYIKEKKTAVKEFEEKKIELKENLIVELEEKKKSIESERTTMELTGDSMEVKPVMTRKLRRRPNDPIPLPEKRRKPSPEPQLNYFLEECEILEDLKIINKISGRPINRKPTSPPSPSEGLSMEVKIEDGRLYYEKRWFHRGQPVYVESKEMGKMSAIISTIGTQELWVKKSDNTKLRIYLSQLQKGKYILRRRSM